MTVTVQQLAELVQGTVVGDGSVPIHAARPLSEAGPGHITFLENDKQSKNLNGCRAAAIIRRPDLSSPVPTAIEVDDPLGAFLKVFERLHARPAPPTHGIDRQAHVHPTARIGEGVSIYPGVFIGEQSVLGDRCRVYPGAVVGGHCRIGDDTTIHPNAVIYDGCTIGSRVVIHANAVIGKDGFGFRFQKGRHVRVPQLGSVEIGDDVEIGACSTIDRGTFQPTRIGEGTKIDNLVQVAHNCQIGKHNVLVSQAGIAGSCTTGDYVVLAGQTGIADHVHLGDRVMVGARAGVMGDIPAGTKVLGTPARAEREFKVWLLSLDKVPEMRKDLQAIKKRLEME